MFDKMINFSLKNRLLILSVSVLLLVIGGYITSGLPVDVFPDLTAPTVTIMTEAHGMATEEVEMLVTFPIETAVNGATNVRRVRSSSANGFSTVWVEFDWGTDIFLARQIVNEKLQLAATSLPEGITPLLTPISSMMGEIMMIGLQIDKNVNQSITYMDLRSMADFDIKRRLLSVNGIAQVITFGGDVKQYKILVSPVKLAAHQISLNEVVETAKKINENSSGGVFNESGNEFIIRGIGRIQTVQDIEQGVVALKNGNPVLIKDIADVEILPAVKYGDASINAEKGIIQVIQKQPQVNTIEITKKIDQALDEIQKTLPEGVIIKKDIFRQADFIESSISNVMSALRDGAILVIVVIFLFLWNFRTTFISAIAIPVSLIITIIIFQFFDIMINTMTLGGMAIAIGALVDDAIIDIENVYRRLKENYVYSPGPHKGALEIIFEASREIRAPMVNATLIIVIVFLPLFFLSGVEGRLLRPMGYAYITSIFASLFVALMLTPVLAYYLLDKKFIMKGTKESWLVSNLQKYYKRILMTVLKHPNITIMSAVVLLVVTISIMPFLGRSFLPEFNEGSLTISMVTIPGTSLEESDKLGIIAEKLISKNKSVAGTSRRVGRADMDEHGQGVNGAEIDVLLKKDGREKEEINNELRKILANIPGTSFTIGQPLSHRIDHMLSGTRANIAIKLFGTNLPQLRRTAEEIKAEIQKVEGAVDVAVEQDREVPQTKLKFNRFAMAKYGVNVCDLADAIDIAFKGETVSQIMEGQNNYDLLVIYGDDYKGNYENIKNALFDTPSGVKVPLSQLAEVVNETGPNRISRENVQRKLVIQSNVSGRDLRSVVDDIQERIDKNIKLPQGYYIDYGGQFESEQAATRIISILSLVSFAAIFMILYVQFKKLKPALFILVNLPLALIGGVWAVFLTDGIVSIASTIGFITLFGIAVRNGILMISHYQHLLDEGVEFTQAVIRGSIERLNPIMMTAITAGLALIPLALGAGETGKEIEAPMAIVILGGLFTSTLLNMIVIPCLYNKFGKE